MIRSILLTLTVLGSSCAASAATVQEHFFGNAIEAGVIYIDGPFEQGQVYLIKTVL